MFIFLSPSNRATFVSYENTCYVQDTFDISNSFALNSSNKHIATLILLFFMFKENMLLDENNVSFAFCISCFPSLTNMFTCETLSFLMLFKITCAECKQPY